jgi:hypothetical protein
MRLAVSIVCASALILGARSRAQDAFGPDGDEDTIKLMAKAYKDQRSVEQIKKDNALIRAAAKGDVDGVRKTLSSGALVNSYHIDGCVGFGDDASGYTALMWASQAGHVGVVKLLIESKADLNLECRNLAERGRTSLYMAVIYRQEAVVKLLVKAGAKGDPKQIRLTRELLRAACRGFKMRVGEGYPPYPGFIGDPGEAQERNALREIKPAAKELGVGSRGDPREIKEVLKRGADVNSADPRGHTALMYAANLGLVDNVKALLAKGADPSLKTRYGETALSLAVGDSSAARAGRREVVELLKTHLAKMEHARSQAMTEKGLHWLAKQQHHDGYWEAEGFGFRVAMTSLAGLAFLMQASNVHDGKYSDQVRKAVDWLVTRSQPDGLIGNPHDPNEAGRYMFGHTYAQLFLAQLYGEEVDHDRQRKLEDVLTRSVVFSAKAQTKRGGWGYVSAADGGQFDHNPNTVVQLQALHAVQHAGIAVPKEVLVKAMDCLKKSTNHKGGIIYSLGGGGGGDGRPPITAAALAACPGEYTDLTRRWLKFCQAKIPLPRVARNRYGDDQFTSYHYGQVAYRLGEDGFGRLFPDTKTEERPTWSRFRQALIKYLESNQTQDGSWEGMIGPVYCTSCYLALLQLDREVLPFYRR